MVAVRSSQILASTLRAYITAGASESMRQLFQVLSGANNPLESGPAAWDNFNKSMKWSLPIIWVCVVGLLGIGLVMVGSIGYTWPAVAQGLGRPTQLVTHHSAAIAVGLVIMFLMARVDYRMLRPLAPLGAVITLVLLVLVLLPAFGGKVHGTRCLFLPGPLPFRPSVLAGAAVVLLLASVLARSGSKQWVMVGLMFVTIIGMLVLAEPDFSAAFIIALTALVVLLLAGQQHAWVLAAYGTGVVVFACLLLQNPSRLRRFLAFFLDGHSHATSYWLPVEAIKSGGWLGLGLGQSTTIQYYRPEAASDFITAVLGEELGWFALLVMALLLVLLVGVGFAVSRCAPDRFGRLLGYGICTLIAVQALVHFAVVMQLLSIRGVALPFVSHGGPGLIVLLGLVGVLLNLARSTRVSAAGVALGPAKPCG
jgi:cell division protein FtsW